MVLVKRVLLVATLACVLLLGSAFPESDLEDEVMEQYIDQDEDEVMKQFIDKDDDEVVGQYTDRDEDEVIEQYNDEDENEVAGQYMEDIDNKLIKKVLEQLQKEAASDQSFSINSRGDLSQLLRALLPYLRSQLLNLRIGDFSGSSGRVSYSLSNIRISDVQFGSTSLTHNYRDTLQLSVTLRVLSGSANWRYRYKKWFVRIGDSGSIRMTAGSVSMTMSVKFKLGPPPTLQASGCSFNIGSLSVRFRGGLSWIYNIFKSKIARKIKDELNRPGRICNAVTPIVTREGTKAIQRFIG